jgi:hypothetical protein
VGVCVCVCVCVFVCVLFGATFVGSPPVVSHVLWYGHYLLIMALPTLSLFIVMFTVLCADHVGAGQ